MEFELLCQQVTDARKQRGDDPRASLPDYVYTEQTNTDAKRTSTEEKENGSQTDSEHQHSMDVSSKTPLNTTELSDVPADTSTISTRNSAKRTKNSSNQRSTITRRQAKEKELINGHNEVRMIASCLPHSISFIL